jgi:hypothetical protein
MLRRGAEAMHLPAPPDPRPLRERPKRDW